MSTIGYAFGEALAGLARRRRSALMSVGTIAIAFFTLGGFLLISSNVQTVVSRWADAAELSVYLADDIDEETRSAIEAELRGHHAVAAVELVTKAAALARFQADFPELADVPETLEANPFPASLEVRIRTDASSAGAAEELARQLADRDGVADVQYDQQWLSRVMGAVQGARIAGFIVAGVLILGAAFTVASVVRLSMVARHEEIEIMQLVGAPFSMIRGPFVVEGAVLGLLGASVALLLLGGLFVLLEGRVGDDFAGLLGAGELKFLRAQDVLLVLASGFCVGAVAGAVASRAAKQQRALPGR